MTVRRLHPHDAEAYRTLRLDALRTEPDSFGATHAVESALPLEVHAARLDASAVFAAADGHSLAGLVGVRQETGTFDHKAMVWGLWVRPSIRGRGVGDALMQAAIDHARMHVRQLHLTVLDRNAPAIALYMRHGFEVYGREPRAIRTSLGLEDELLMARLF